MKKTKVSQIKRARRSSFLFNEVASSFVKIVQDNPQLIILSPTRAELSDKGSVCTVYFTCDGGVGIFEKKLSDLLLYKATLRHAIAQALNSRRCPDLMFSYDHELDAVRDLEAVFDSLKKIEED